MKVLGLILAMLNPAETNKVHSQHLMNDSYSYSAVAFKIDSLKIQQEKRQTHFACKAGFENREKCVKFYKMMLQLKNAITN